MTTNRPVLFLDEDVSVELATLLRDQGLEVHTVQEVGIRSVPDAVILQKCIDEGWILITRNRRDFRRLHWLWMTFNRWRLLSKPHSGILTIYEGAQSPSPLPEEWTQAILRLLEETPNFDGLMFVWRPSTQQWETQPEQFM